VLQGIIRDVRKGTTTSHILIDVKGVMITSSITNDAVADLGLTVGSKVSTIIKSSDVMIAVA
jgi:molybdopterin-binding protein